MAFDGVNAQQVVSDLMAARELVQRGWIQRSFFCKQSDGVCLYCARGAILETCMGGVLSRGVVEPEPLPEQGARIAAAETALARVMSMDWLVRLEFWLARGRYKRVLVNRIIERVNDDGETTKADILWAFDRAVARARRRVARTVSV